MTTSSPIFSQPIWRLNAGNKLWVPEYSDNSGLVNFTNFAAVLSLVKMIAISKGLKSAEIYPFYVSQVASATAPNTFSFSNTNGAFWMRGVQVATWNPATEFVWIANQGFSANITSASIALSFIESPDPWVITAGTGAFFVTGRHYTEFNAARTATGAATNPVFGDQYNQPPLIIRGTL